LSAKIVTVTFLLAAQGFPRAPHDTLVRGCRVWISVSSNIIRSMPSLNDRTLKLNKNRNYSVRGDAKEGLQQRLKQKHAGPGGVKKSSLYRGPG
jgi:hypothetical protein